MCEADGCRCEGAAPLFEREDLAASLDLPLSDDPDAADALARLFDSFRQAMDSGLQGINETRRALLISVELAYLHSSAHASALKLYRLSLEGHLKVRDEPVRLINAAIGRRRGVCRRRGGLAGRAAECKSCEQNSPQRH